MASYVEDLVKCGFLEMKLPRKQRKLTHKVSCEQPFFCAVGSFFLLLSAPTIFNEFCSRSS